MIQCVFQTGQEPEAKKSRKSSELRDVNVVIEVTGKFPFSTYNNVVNLWAKFCDKF